MRTEVNANEDGSTNITDRLLKIQDRNDKTRSPSSDSIKSHTGGDSSVIMKTGNGILRTPIVLQKPRPWSVVGNEPKTSNGNDSSKTTPEKLDDGKSLQHFNVLIFNFSFCL